MAAQFPSIKPSERSFRPGQYPTKSYRALSGAIVKRAFGNRAYGHELQLSFNNVKDSVTIALVDHYNSTRGGFDRFTLPAELFAGMDASLRTRLQAPTQIKWEYSGPPDIKSVFNGLSSITITLLGELEY
jgi:hypothetical protein